MPDVRNVFTTLPNSEPKLHNYFVFKIIKIILTKLFINFTMYYTD